jgi:hypothetical protein
LISFSGSEYQKQKQEVQGKSTEIGISPVIKYRLLVGGVGIAYEGESESEAGHQFNMFMAKSKNPKSSSAGEAVMLFKNYEVIREHRPPRRE